MKHFTIIISLYALILISGCSSEPKTENWPVERFYSEGKEALDNEDFERAIKFYEKLEGRYPFGKYAQQSQLYLIYAYYKSEDPELAIVAANRFLKLYPRHKVVDYVYYLKGLISFKTNQGTLDSFLPLERSQRDQSWAMRAFNDFSLLISRFPNSKYSEDARQRMIYLRDMLAKHELQVAKFYMKRGAYVAAANRAKTVIQSYPRTASVPKALVILAKAYKIVGIDDLSDSALRILKLNYPEHSGITEVNNLVVK